MTTHPAKTTSPSIYGSTPRILVVCVVFIPNNPVEECIDAKGFYSQIQRRQFKDDMANFRPEQFVNLDESAYDRKTAARSHGWSVKCHRADVRSFFTRGKRFKITSGHDCNPCFWIALHNLNCYWVVGSSIMHGLFDDWEVLGIRIWIF